MIGLVTILWAIVGYSLAFGHGNLFMAGLSTCSCAAFR
jgi:ammonium transporter, Amt family